jgi:hypothetical protein
MLRHRRLSLQQFTKPLGLLSLPRLWLQLPHHVEIVHTTSSLLMVWPSVRTDMTMMPILRNISTAYINVAMLPDLTTDFASTLMCAILPMNLPLVRPLSHLCHQLQRYVLILCLNTKVFNIHDQRVLMFLFTSNRFRHVRNENSLSLPTLKAKQSVRMGWIMSVLCPLMTHTYHSTLL